MSNACPALRNRLALALHRPRWVVLVVVCVASLPLPRAMAERPSLSGAAETIGSADGRFLVHFTRTGVDAVSDLDVAPRNGTPDYVDDVLEGLTRAHERWVVQDGWPEAPGDLGAGGDDRLDVYVKRITCAEASGVTACGPAGRPPSSLFGVTRGERSLAGSTNRATSYILLNPDNDVPLGRNFAKSVAAHELHHSIQFGMDTREPNWVYESTAAYLQLTLFEILEETPYIVDVLLLDRLARPEAPLTSREGRMEYSNALWFRFLVDRFESPTIVRDVWRRLAQSPSQGLYDAFDAELLPHGTTFDAALAEWGEWNYFLCGRDDGRHYDAGGACVSPNRSVRIAATHRTYPVADAAAPVSPESMGMTYLELEPDASSRDVTAELVLPGAPQAWRVRAVRVGRDCQTSAVDVPVMSDGRAVFTAEAIQDAHRVVLIVVNVARTGPAPAPFRYSLRGVGVYSGVAVDRTVRLSALTASPTSLALARVGDVGRVFVDARASDCTGLNVTRNVSTVWRSLDEAVATVDGSGLVVARGEGATTILLGYSGLEARVAVQVGTPKPVAPPPANKGGCASTPDATASALFACWLLALAIALVSRRRVGHERFEK